LGPVAGVSSKVENLSNDMAEVKSNVNDLTSQMNKIRQQLTDISNAIKVIQAPPPPPPAPNTAQGQTAPPVPATKLFSDALNDYSSGKSDLAVEEFSEFLRSYPDDPNAPKALIQIGQVHLAQQKYDQAVEDFNRAAELEPSDAMSHGLAGKALSKLNRHVEAIADYQKALELQPDLWEVRIALGDELVATGRNPEAMQAYAEAVRMKPDNVLAHMDLGVLLARTGQFDGALREFDETLRLDPGNQQARDYRTRVQGWKARGP
jgi:Flp pilus assembly protein TadD